MYWTEENDQLLDWARGTIAEMDGPLPDGESSRISKLGLVEHYRVRYEDIWYDVDPYRYMRALQQMRDRLVKAGSLWEPDWPVPWKELLTKPVAGMTDLLDDQLISIRALRVCREAGVNTLKELRALTEKALRSLIWRADWRLGDRSCERLLEELQDLRDV